MNGLVVVNKRTPSAKFITLTETKGEEKTSPFLFVPLHPECSIEELKEYCLGRLSCDFNCFNKYSKLCSTSTKKKLMRLNMLPVIL